MMYRLNTSGVCNIHSVLRGHDTKSRGCLNKRRPGIARRIAWRRRIAAVREACWRSHSGCGFWWIRVLGDKRC
jgi:hypothetical protein